MTDQQSHRMRPVVPSFRVDAVETLCNVAVQDPYGHQMGFGQTVGDVVTAGNEDDLTLRQVRCHV